MHVTVWVLGVHWARVPAGSVAPQTLHLADQRSFNKRDGTEQESANRPVDLSPTGGKTSHLHSDEHERSVTHGTTAASGLRSAAYGVDRR